MPQLIMQPNVIRRLDLKAKKVVFVLMDAYHFNDVL